MDYTASRRYEIYRRTHPSILPSEPPSLPLPTPHHHLSSTSIFFCSFLSLIKHVLFLLRKPHAGAYTEGRGLWDLKPQLKTPVCKYGVLCHGKLEILVKSQISLSSFSPNKYRVFVFAILLCVVQ